MNSLPAAMRPAWVQVQLNMAAQLFFEAPRRAGLLRADFRPKCGRRHESLQERFPHCGDPCPDAIQTYPLRPRLWLCICNSLDLCQQRRVLDMVCWLGIVDCDVSLLLWNP